MLINGVTIPSVAQVKKLGVIPKFIFIPLAASTFLGSFVDYISDTLTPFICFHFHLYPPSPIFHNCLLTYYISALLVSLFLLLPGPVNCFFCSLISCSALCLRELNFPASLNLWFLNRLGQKKEMVEDCLLWCLLHIFLCGFSSCQIVPPNSTGKPFHDTVSWMTEASGPCSYYLFPWFLQPLAMAMVNLTLLHHTLFELLAFLSAVCPVPSTKCPLFKRP